MNLIYLARCVERNAKPEAYLKRRAREQRLTRGQVATVQRLVEIIRPLLQEHCIAKAEALALEQYQQEQVK